MVAEKIMKFEGKNKDLGKLTKQIVQKLNADGYKTQWANSPNGMVIQAQKGGVLRDIIAADRAFTIMLSGAPNDFTVKVGIGKFAQNLAVTAAESIVVSGLFLAVDVPEMLWTKYVEDGVAKDIEDIANQK